jgi:hypothetical protein
MHGRGKEYSWTSFYFWLCQWLPSSVMSHISHRNKTVIAGLHRANSAKAMMIFTTSYPNWWEHDVIDGSQAGCSSSHRAIPTCDCCLGSMILWIPELHWASYKHPTHLHLDNDGFKRDISWLNVSWEETWTLDSLRENGDFNKKTLSANRRTWRLSNSERAGGKR